MLCSIARASCSEAVACTRHNNTSTTKQRTHDEVRIAVQSCDAEIIAIGMCHFQRTALGLVSLFFISLLLGQLLGQPPVAPPAILQHGIVNAASRMPPDVPGGSIARGSLFTIYGVRLGPETPALGEVALRFT